jgi:hypothetical protein
MLLGQKISKNVPISSDTEFDTYAYFQYYIPEPDDTEEFLQCKGKRYKIAKSLE